MLESLETHSPRPGRRDLHLSTPIDIGARSLAVTREQALSGGLYERITIDNLTDERITDTLTVTVGTGFLDLFEVRGEREIERDVSVRRAETGVSFVYDPSDTDFERETHVRTDREPEVTTAEGDTAAATLRLDVDIAPGGSETLVVATAFDEPQTDLPAAHRRACTRIREREQEWGRSVTVPDTADQSRATVLAQSVEDLLSLRLETDHGPVLAAGTPWFATAFGRDSLIAAYQTLPLTTEPAEGALRYLAAHQAAETDDFRDAQPGKIFHEIRRGELTHRSIKPHSPYYGTVDATALWIVLLHETYERTGDESLVEDLWDALEAALDWLETHGDSDGDGFLEYGTDSEDTSLTHQAWKDSDDGIMHGDGTVPHGPIAPAEVQGYYYDALTRAASLFEEFGDTDRAGALRERADEMQSAFDEQFWLPEESFYAVALDGANEPIECVSTNPGQCLWSGIVPEERADDVIDRLVADDMFSGYGIRTVSADHDVYNPQSYHLGSVWPHDNSLIVLGMVAYDRVDAAERVTDGLFQAAVQRGNDRLPELFAGFDRATTDVPIEYGVACEPQAWAAAAPVACHAALASTETDPAQEVPTRTD
jgi:glycogen debranching enzyme